MMSPRERVLAAIRHAPTDRTPRDFWAEKPALNRLFEAVGHRDEERLLERLGIDIRHLNGVEPAERQVSPDVYRNFWGEQYTYRETPWGPIREDLAGALAAAESLAQIEAFAFPTPDDMDYSLIKSQLIRWDRYAICYGFADVWQRPALVRGWENWFLDLLERPEWVHFLCRKFTDFYREEYTRAAEVSGGRIDIFLLISDLGSQHGPLISKEMFRQFVPPYLREMVDHSHQLGASVLYHSCGQIAPFIPELIRIGVDILDPIQPVAPAMMPEELNARFGGQLCFHGGIDMQQLLPHGTPDEVRREADRYREAFGGSGYIMAPAHLFQPDVPPENILALYSE